MEQKSIKKNMVMSILLTLARFVFPLITYSYVARVLEPDGTGRVAFVNSVLSYFSYFAMLGIPIYGVREISKIRDNKEQLYKTFHELFILNTLSTIVAYSLLILAVLVVPQLYQEKTLFLVMGSCIALDTIGVEWLYKALEEYSYITIRSIAFKLISVILTFVLIKSRTDVEAYGFVLLFGNYFAYILNYACVHRHLKRYRGLRFDYKKHLRPMLTLFAASAIITIYENFDITMIGFINSESEVGLYNAALKIKMIVLSLSTAVTTVIIPRVAYYFSNNERGRIEELIEKSLRISFDLSIPVAVFVLSFSKEGLSLLCGNEYLDATKTLRVLLVCIGPLILTNLFGNQLLIPLGMEKRFSQSVFVGLWINLLLNALLIPKYGAFGAALGTLITECWNVYWMSKGVPEYRSMLISRIDFRTYLFPLSLVAIIGVALNSLIRINMILKLVISGIVFFGIYYAVLFIEKEPIILEQISRIKKRLNA